MPRSILVSASAELAPVAAPRAPIRPRVPMVAAVVRTPLGRTGAILTAVTMATAVMGPVLASVDPFALAGEPLTPPSPAHPMGTDGLGRDVLSGVLHGARTSLFVAGAVSAVAFACGLLVGMVAGYRGGWLDDVLMRLTELFQVLPRFFLVVVAIALFGPGLDRLILTLGLTSWPVLARVVRGEVVAMRELEFVRAAQAAGASGGRILWRELLPNVMPGALVMLGLLFAQVLLVEASLGFLGLGDPGTMSWGVLAGQAQGFLRAAWWLAVFPGLAIALAVLGINLLADALASRS